MTAFSISGWAVEDFDRRSGSDFSSTVVCDAACETIADLLFNEGALPGSDLAADPPLPRSFTERDIWMYG